MNRRDTARHACERVRAQIEFQVQDWRARSERGDVPGWVLITVMTAGLVAALWLIAEPLLSSLFSSAISGVSGP